MAFQSPFVDCRISNPKTGRTASLSLFGEDETLPYVQEVRLDMARNVNLGMSMTLSPTYEEALKLISKDSEWLRLGNTMSIRWGYSDMEGMMSDWHYGFMVQPQISFGEEILITIEGKALAWHMDRLSRSREWSTPENPVSLLSIAVEISERYGMEVVHAVVDEKSKIAMETKRNSFSQGGRTDLQFLMFEVERCGARMIIQNHKLYIIDSEAPLPDFPDVNATFGMYAKVDVTNNVLPIMSFSTESMGGLFIKNVYGIKTLMFGPDDDPEEEPKMVKVSYDTESKNHFSSPNTYGSGSNSKTAEGTSGSIQVDDELMEGGRIYSPPLDGSQSQEFIESQLSGVLNDSMNENGVVAKFSSFAIPNLLPGMFVNFIGVGDFFSTTYMINDLSVVISSDGAMMDGECFSRGFPSADPDFGAMAKEVNTSNEPYVSHVDELKNVKISGGGR